MFFASIFYSTWLCFSAPLRQVQKTRRPRKVMARIIQSMRPGGSSTILVARPNRPLQWEKAHSHVTSLSGMPTCLRSVSTNFVARICMDGILFRLEAQGHRELFTTAFDALEWIGKVHWNPVVRRYVTYEPLEC